MEFSYNNNHDSTIQMSPFQVLHGQDCRTPINCHDPLIKIEATREVLDEMQWQKTLIQEIIKSMQQKYQSWANNKRINREIEVGNKLFVRVKEKRSTLTYGKYKKLSPRYCGLNTITKRVGNLAYQLLLPKNVKVHNVFHVSLLKKYIADPSHVLNDGVMVMPN